MESKAERRTFSDAIKAGVSRKFKAGSTFKAVKTSVLPLHTDIVRKKSVIWHSDREWGFVVESARQNVCVRKLLTCL